MIKELNTEDDLIACADVVRQSFLTVANDLGLTKENCPTNGAFMPDDGIIRLKEKGLHFYGMFSGKDLVGCVAIEKAEKEENTYYVEKLAVLPGHRHKNYGEKMMNFALEFIKNQGGKRCSIAVVNENLILKKWYERLSFKETSLKKFDHLPFTVCFMERFI